MSREAGQREKLLPDHERQDRWVAARYANGFRNGIDLTVGLEEELLLVDPKWFLPVDEIDAVLELAGDPDRFRAELRASQLEIVSPVCLAVPDAARELARGRADVVAALAGRLRLLAAGTHPLALGPVSMTPRERYLDMGRDCAWILRRGHSSGLHVHVGLVDESEALAIYNAARSWLPLLGALAANSPFFEGYDSGLASTRMKLNEDLPRAGIPPAFSSWLELAQLTGWASRGGLFPDLTYLWWDVRPRPDYGTIEFRVADTQTRTIDTAAFAAVCQTLVAWLQWRYRNGEQLPAASSDRLAENRWRTLRDGLDAHIVDPQTGCVQLVREELRRLIDQLAPFATELACEGELAHAAQLVERNGAERQRETAAAQGIDGLLEALVVATEQVEAEPLRAVEAA